MAAFPIWAFLKRSHPSPASPRTLTIGLEALFFFFKWPHLLVVLSEHVEEEGLHVVVERLVVEERLGDQTKVLTVLLVLLTTHLKRQLYVSVDKKNSYLKDRELVFSVDLVTRGMFPNALLSVSLHHAGSLGG